jgi:PAS domain S-box-containing protein
MKVIHETTKRKLVEYELQYRNELLIEAQQIACMGNWVFDIQTGISNWSNEVYKLFGVEKIVGQSTFEILEQQVFPEDYKIIQNHAGNLIANGIPYQSQYRIKRKDGSIRMISTQGKPEFNSQGKVIKIKGVCQDVTARWEAMEKINELNTALELKVKERTLELSKKNEELLKINSDLDNFIYTASHDLKAPISNIEGLVINLSEELKAISNEDINTMLSLMHHSINRFKNTIKELTEITKIQKDIQEYENEELRFSSIMEDVQFSLETLMKESSPILEVNFAVDSIKFSKKNLRSIIYNLISNGIKYRSNDRKCHISLTTTKQNEWVVLSVKDNGLGINQSQISKIFSMFKRLHDHVEGTGVGLYIVKRIIDNAGGKIEVSSQEGVGTEFKVFFKSN